MNIGWLPTTCFKSLEELERLHGMSDLTTDELREMFFRVYEGGAIGAYDNPAVYGYLLYEAKNHVIDIRSLYVLESFRNNGIATSFFKFLILSPITSFNTDVKIVIPEKELLTLEWAHRRGFQARKLVKGYFVDQDGIEMWVPLKEGKSCLQDTPAQEPRLHVE